MQSIEGKEKHKTKRNDEKKKEHKISFVSNFNSFNNNKNNNNNNDNTPNHFYRSIQIFISMFAANGWATVFSVEQQLLPLLRKHLYFMCFSSFFPFIVREKKNIWYR